MMFQNYKYTVVAALLAVCSCRQQQYQFEKLPAAATNITFSNDIDSSKAYRALYFFYLYNGGGVATGDINNDGLPDIFFTANSRGGNKLYLNKGNFVFEDITAKAGVAGNADWCTGVTMADVNGDGFLDIYVSALTNVYNFTGRNELYISNKGDGSFTESAAQYGLDIAAWGNQAAFFDYDHDGDLDCYILNESFKPSETLSDTSSRRKPDANSGDRFLRNDISTTGKFTDVSAQTGIYQGNVGYGLGLAEADMNNDGWDDVYVGNDFQENDYYYVNKGDGTFTEEGARHFAHYSRFSMGNDIADYNNDGQPDIFTADMLPPDEKILKTYGSGEAPDIYKQIITKNGYQTQYSKNCLQRNNGSGTSFSETALQSGVAATDWSWCPLFADFDNDGNKDLFITSGVLKRTTDMDYIRFLSGIRIAPGEDKKIKYNEALTKMPDGISHNYLYKGNGSLQFDNISSSGGFENDRGYFNGAAYADLDNDGDLDLVANSINAPAAVYKNNNAAKNHLSVSFKGDGLNTKGVGAKAYLFSKNKLQYQQLQFTRGFQSASATNLHFGLDSLSTADSLLVVWPDQRIQVIKNIAANKTLTVEQKNAAGHFTYSDYFKPAKEMLSPSGNTVAWQHKENDFNDFNYQYLLPHAQSTRGPKLAAGDVNKDGRDDLFVCGAKGQAGAMLVQQANGSFIAADTALFNTDKDGEDVDAVFFDADGDNDADLYVVSGGNEYSGNNIALADRLYMNDGKGHFTKSNSLPQIFANKSCVAVADIDKDGDMDLFAGTLADANAYGVPQTSHLLLNDGKGNFTKAADATIALTGIGMVTAAAFADVNKDGWPDLAVAGEWMPLTIFINQKGIFSKTTVPGSTGLWQTLFVDDVNNDGHADILAGNWGLNNKFCCNRDGALKLYVGDFDNNGKKEQLLSSFFQQEEYPFLPKDMIEQQLPSLKKRYLLYSGFAGVPMKEVFAGCTDTVTPLTAAHLGSAVCFGNGTGQFTLTDLPADLQLSPIFSFQKIKNDSGGGNCYLSGGNFFGVLPYEGRYDAQALGMFSIFKNRQVSFLPQQAIAGLQSEVRDIKWLQTGNGKPGLVCVAQNNDKVLFYTVN
jgi:enediyne biosynthesis protein E4